MRPIDWFLFASSIVAIALAGCIAVFTPTPGSPAQPALMWPPAVYLGVISFTTLIWGVSWWRYGQIVRELEKMAVDDKEADFWRDFKKRAKNIKAKG